MKKLVKRAKKTHIEIYLKNKIRMHINQHIHLEIVKKKAINPPPSISLSSLDLVSVREKVYGPQVLVMGGMWEKLDSMRE